MKNLYLSITFMFLLLAVSSQDWTQNLPQDKLQNGELTLYDYEKAFDDYWGPYNVENGYYYVNGEKTKAPGWKLFKRWVWKMEFYCDAEGNFPTTSTSEELRKYNQKYPNAAKSSSGNWSNVGYNATPGGYQGVGRINTVAFHPTDVNTFWTGSASGGMWKTTDGGSTWTVQTDALEVMGVSAIGIPSDHATSGIVYLGTGDRDAGGTLNSGMGHHSEGIGVLKSTDGGSTWNTTGLSFPQSNLWVINDLLILPSDNNTIYAATNAGLYKTTDGGTTWPLLYAANSFIDLEFKPGDPTIMYGAKKEYWGDGNIYRSTDGGANFTPIALPGSSSRRTELAVSANDPTVVYALTVNSSSGLEGIYKSTNSGASFSLIYSVGGGGNNLMGYDCADVGTSGQGRYDVFLTANPANVDDVYAGGINIWRTTNGGTSWSIKSHWSGDCGGTVNTVHADQHSCDFQDGGTVFVGNDGGIYKSTDNGSNWTDLSNGLTINQIYRLGVSQQSSNEVIIGLQDNGTHLYTGGTWLANGVLGGDGMECIIDPTNDNVQFGEYPSGDIQRCTDHWAQWWTWISVRDNIRTAAGDPNLGGAWVTPYMLDPNTNNNLFVGFEELWKSTDQGVTSGNFSQISNFGGGDGDIKALQIAKSNSSYIYVGFNNTLYRTINGGTTWSDITGTLPIVSNKLTYIAVKNDDENTVWVTIGGFNGDAVYETTNGGTTWTNISAGLPQLPAMSIVQNIQNTDFTELYVSMSGGVWVKYGAANWVSFNTNFISVFCSELDIYYDNTTPANSMLRVGTFGRGLWESDLYTPPAPIADFEADNTEPTSEFDWVAFTDLSTNGPTSWLWTITPATHTYHTGSSTSQNPDVYFDVPGAYTIALTATNASGFDTETKIDYIHMGIPGDWTGATNGDWNTTSNWHNYMVPVSSTDVNIPTAAANYPFFSGDFTLGTECSQITMEDDTEFDVSGDLTIAPGKALYCADGATIYVGGDWTNNGTFDPLTGTVNFYGTNPSTINIPTASPVYLIDDDISTWPGNWNGDIGTWTGGNGSGMFSQQFSTNTGGSSPEAGFEYINLDPGTRRLYYNAVNTSGLTSLTLDFQHMVDDYDGSAGYMVKVQYSTDGTNWFDSDWTVSPTGNIAASQVSTTLTSVSHGVGATNYYISFTITGNLYNLDYWYIDDIKLHYTDLPSETFNNLTISKEFEVVTTNGTGTINVDNDLTVLPWAWFTNSAGITIEVGEDVLLGADEFGSASFIDNGTTNYGNAVVESYISQDQWHFVSPPVSGSTINVYNDIYLKEYNEPTNDWTYLVTPTTTPMIVGKGYSSWASNSFPGSTTVSYQGTLANVDVYLSGFSYSPVTNIDKFGFHLIGNPFPCALDWNSNWNMTDMSGWMIIYDNGVSKGIHTDGTPWNGMANSIIPATQGFWVRATSASASLTIPASQRVHNNQAFYKETKEIDYPYISIQSEINGYKDEALVIFHPECTSSYDGYYDLSKFDNVDEAPNLYTADTESNNYAVNFYDEIYLEKVIPVGFKTGEAGLYSVNASKIVNFDDDLNIYLEDIKTGSVTNLTEIPTYEFYYQPGDDELRFNLHFKNSWIGITDQNYAGINIFAYDQVVYIQMQNAQSGQISVFDIIGQEISSKRIFGNKLVKIPVNTGSGYYIIKVQTDKTITTQKVFIN